MTVHTILVNHGRLAREDLEEDFEMIAASTEPFAA